MFYLQVYHSTFNTNDSQDRRVGNFVLLPLSTQFRGPAYANNSDYDIIDECLDLFRANSFFKNFEINSDADRVLIYGILFINYCLQHLKAATTRTEAVKILTNVALEDFKLPGTAGFPLNTVYQIPTNEPQQLDLLKGYLQQFRQELATRLIDRLYLDNDVPNKHWLAFTKRKFMNKSL